MVKVAPSILAADFANLQSEIEIVERAGADWIHVDVMDGHFVPNITMGALVVDAIRPHTKLPLDVHLMIEQPDQFIESFAKAGADIITVHVEACRHLHRTLHYIKSFGIQCGVVLNPHTPISTIEHLLEDVDVVLFMTVNPGFGGQSFIPSVLQKVKALAELKEQRGLNFEIEIDGGVNKETVKECVSAGATVVVAGSAIYGAADKEQALQDIKEA
ncbi:ribulose-phosphate 3-epimerase [Chryseomicrobium excrementi]|uniref:Ribulose-phosphate 3-epimerase n=1 Tax=Chryseomicrobium excrementi TaxID=2041346 RepID=A0A2M9F369_9BACL|nr:ribulose-phosphate 3-epimerase [Chryseomicrobium excrementi]PJK17912.1 ribulose-phosphate 3-epimerase [Chryseomicrobium excrementi]